MEFYHVYEKSYSNMGVNYFIYFKNPSILAERIYKLKNFDMNFKGCHLGCVLL